MMRKIMTIVAVAGFVMAVSGTAGATWTIDIDHSGTSLNGSLDIVGARTGYLDNSTWSWTISGWDTVLPDTHADPPGTLAQLFGQVDFTAASGYIDVRARAGMDPNNNWNPGVPTTAGLTYDFDFPYVNSVTVGSNYLEAVLADNWGDTYGGTGYLQIMGQHQWTVAEQASGLWPTYIWDGSVWVPHATARYALSYDDPTNTYNNSAFSWGDFDWLPGGWFDIDFLLVETGLTIDGGTGLIEELTVPGAAVPEPMSMVMLGSLGAGMFAARRMRRRKKDA